MILAKNILISLKFLREKKNPAPIDKKTPIYMRMPIISYFYWIKIEIFQK